MVRCYLTGVQFPLEQGLVLNRRATRDLLNLLSDRVASLRRLLEQFGPLDAPEVAPGSANRPEQVRKRHRMVCKSVADAMAPAFPEIELFQSWAQYRAQVRSYGTPRARFPHAHSGGPKRRTLTGVPDGNSNSNS